MKTLTARNMIRDWEAANLDRGRAYEAFEALRIMGYVSTENWEKFDAYVEKKYREAVLKQNGDWKEAI